MKRDRIFLEGLEVKCVIGIFDWERKVKQKVVVDLEFPADTHKAARQDIIRHTVDYKRIAKSTIHFIAGSRFQLIETLAEKLSGHLLREFRLPELRLRLAKPGAIRGARNVGVEIFRKKR